MKYPPCFCSPSNKGGGAYRTEPQLDEGAYRTEVQYGTLNGVQDAGAYSTERFLKEIHKKPFG